jgi:hypothetical protein
MIYLMNNNSINLKNFKAFLILLEEAYGDYNHINTNKQVLSK